MAKPCEPKLTGRVIMAATARSDAGYSFFDSSVPETVDSHIGKVALTAVSRIKSGRIHYIGATCGVLGTATATGQEGGGLFSLHGKTKGSAAGAGLPLNPDNRLRATASLVVSPEVSYKGCLACSLSGDSVLYVDGFVNEYWLAKGTAATQADWVGKFEASITAGAVSSETSTAAVDYNMSVGMGATASTTANQFEGSITMGATADTASRSVTFLPNGLVKLDGIGEILLNLLPQYMQEGDIIRKILEVYETELSRAVYIRSGHPTLVPQEGLLQQFFVITATWGLDLWEALVGLPVQSGNTDYTLRRNLILAQLSARKRESEFWFKKRLEDVSGGTVIINPHEPAVDPYTIDIESNVMLGEQAPDVPLVAVDSGSPGVLTGTYTYRMTYVFATGETDAGDSESNSVTVTNGRIAIDPISVSGSNETLTLTNGGASGGDFTLKFSTGSGYFTTNPIPYNATGPDIDAELGSLINIGVTNLDVIGPAGGPWTIAFQNNLGARPIFPGLRIDSDNTTGGTGIILTKIREGSSSGAFARKLYRRKDPTGDWIYLATINDNSTTAYVDNATDASISSNPLLSPYNTAVTVFGAKFLDYINKTKPAHLHVDVRSERFRASINTAGDPV